MAFFFRAGPARGIFLAARPGPRAVYGPYSCSCTMVMVVVVEVVLVVESFKIYSDLSYLSDHELSFGNDEPS